MSLNELFILTDARGFTTCCEPLMEALLKEAGRVPLEVPVIIKHWVRGRVDPLRVVEDWSLVQTFPWNGSPF